MTHHLITGFTQEQARVIIFYTGIICFYLWHYAYFLFPSIRKWDGRGRFGFYFGMWCAYYMT